MRTLHHASKIFADELAAFCRGAVVSKEISDSVAAILADVRQRGDEAVAYYAAKFDGAKLRARDFRVPAAELAAAAKRLSAADTRALSAARENIVAFNSRGLPKAWNTRNKHGASVGEKFDPIRRVGIYVPGGEVPLVSTVLMTTTLAKIARCPEIAVFTPSNSAGKIADGLLAALHLLGIEEVYRIGGVQAVGAIFAPAVQAVVDAGIMQAAAVARDADGGGECPCAFLDAVADGIRAADEVTEAGNKGFVGHGVRRLSGASRGGRYRRRGFGRLFGCNGRPCRGVG